MSLATFLAPVTVENFVDGYLERTPLHVKRNDASYFEDVYGVSDVEETLVAGSRAPERIALVQAGRPQMPVADYTVTDAGIRAKSTGKTPVTRVDVRKVTAFFDAGYTIVISDAGAFSAHLQRTCNALQNEFGAYVGANVYFTPPGAQGFDLHHDSHDIMTAQIEGTKTWRIYEPAIALPIESQPMHRGVNVPPLKVFGDVTLQPGDTLYIPRGFAHEAVAGGDRALHVTFAIAPVRVIDLLESALAAGANRIVDLRRALPFGWHRRPTFGKEFAEIIAPFAATIFGRDQLNAAADGTLNDLFAASRSEAGGAFDQIARAKTLTPETEIALNSALPHLLRERENTLDILVPGKTLHLPKACLAAMRRLEAGPVTLATLEPDFSDGDRELFVRTLVLEGLLTLD